ncbi:MAG: ABC transporter permease [Beijerinckiaceae bacterium]
MGLARAVRHHLVTAGLLAPVLIFLLLWFVAPLINLLSLSLADRRGAFAAYEELLTGESYRRVFVKTFTVSASVTLLALVLAYPVAWALTRLRGKWLLFAFWCVLFPFWISVLVRTFAWMLLLEKNGPLNRLLTMLSGAEQPLSLLFNDTAVLIGMTHIMVPYAVLPIYAALIRIDGRLLLASDGLGAAPLTTFRRVYLPLSFHGIAAAAVLVFLLSLGFFITPALLGGIGSTTLSMLIEQLVDERLVWPLAAAGSFLLLAMTLLLILVAGRLMPIGTTMAAK